MPTEIRFQYDGREINITDYFQLSYNKTITDMNQPCFLVKIGDRNCYLPPEFCLIDGVPDSIRKGSGMRDALAMTRVSPQ